MADNTVSFGIEYIFSGGNSTKALKGVKDAASALNKDIDRLRKQEELYSKAEKELARQLKSGAITKQEHITLSKRQAQAYMKITKDSSKLRKVYDDERRALERKNKAQEIANAGLGRLGISSGAIGGAAGLAVGAGVAGVAGLGALANNQFNSQRELQRNAELLGLGARELEGVTYAMSKLAAVSKDEAVDGLMDIRERLGEIADDVDGSLGKAARAIGLDANRLKGMRVDKQINGIVSALSKLDTEARLFRSRELFGDSAALMLTGAAGDQKRFQDLQQKGERNAVLLDDASMKSLAEFKEATDSLKTSLTRILLPAVNVLAKAAGNIAEGFEDQDKRVTQLDHIHRLENAILKAGGTLPEPKQASYGGIIPPATGNRSIRAGKDNRFVGQSLPESYLRNIQDKYWAGIGNKTGAGAQDKYLMELAQRRAQLAKVLDQMGLNMGADPSDYTNQPPMSVDQLPYDMSKLDEMIGKENRIDDIIKGKNAYMLAGYSERAASVYAEMDRAREEALDAAKEAGASDKELVEVNDKYVTVAELRVARIEKEEEAAKAEAERAKKAREEYTKSVKAARAAYEADVKRASEIQNMIEEAFVRADNQIQEQFERSMALAEGPALKGQNAFKGGSVEEFQFVSDMIAQREQDSAVEKAEERAQQQRQALAELKERSDQQIEEKLQELRGGLEGKLEALISAINSKE